MTVVAAGVHLAFVHRAVIEGVLLQDLQRVHVGAQADGAFAAAFFQHADNPGVTDRAMHLEAEALQQLGDLVRGAVFLEGEFRMAMDVVPPGLHARLQRRGRGS